MKLSLDSFEAGLDGLGDAVVDGLERVDEGVDQLVETLDSVGSSVHGVLSAAGDFADLIAAGYDALSGLRDCDGHTWIEIKLRGGLSVWTELRSSLLAPLLWPLVDPDPYPYPYPYPYP